MFGEREEREIIIVRESFRGFKWEADRYKFRMERDIVEEFLEERR